MKILLISDSHGKKSCLNELINNPIYDYIFHMGDGSENDLGTAIYDSRVVYVKGNCDYFCDGAITQTLYLCDKKILITHGHEYKVKYGMETLSYFAKANGYQLVCFGHTHIQTDITIDGIRFINPGALKNGEYAELIVNNDDIKVIFKTIKEIE